MTSRRTLIIAIVLVVLVLAGLGVAALLLFGNEGLSQDSDWEGTKPAETGIVFVKSIETYGQFRLTTPVGIGAGSDGGFYVTLRDQAAVVQFDRQGDYVRHWGERGLEQGQMMIPLGVAVDRAGDRVYVTDRSRLRLLCYDLEGTYRWEVPILNPLTPSVTDEGVAVTTFGPLVLLDAEGGVLGEYGSRGELPGQFDYPRGIAVTDSTSAIIADTNNARVQRVEFSGDATATAAWVYGRPPLNQDDDSVILRTPSGVSLDERGYAYVLDAFGVSNTDAIGAQITVLNSDSGEVLHRFDFNQGVAEGQLYLPTGIAFLGDSTFAITDTANNRVQIFRLLMPEENIIVRRAPWVWWLLGVPLLLLPFLFGRKRWFVTAETMERASADRRLRLLAAVFKRVHMLPEVYGGYAEAVEEGIALGGYLVSVEPSAEMRDAESAEERLASAAAPGPLGKLLLRRHIIVCADESQCARFSELDMKTRTYDQIAAEFAIDGESPPNA